MIDQKRFHWNTHFIGIQIGSKLCFLTEVSDGRRDALRGYLTKIRLGILRFVNARRYFSLW